MKDSNRARRAASSEDPKLALLKAQLATLWGIDLALAQVDDLRRSANQGESAAAASSSSSERAAGENIRCTVNVHAGAVASTASSLSIRIIHTAESALNVCIRFSVRSGATADDVQKLADVLRGLLSSFLAQFEPSVTASGQYLELKMAIPSNSKVERLLEGLRTFKPERIDLRLDMSQSPTTAQDNDPFLADLSLGVEFTRETLAAVKAAAASKWETTQSPKAKKTLEMVKFVEFLNDATLTLNLRDCTALLNEGARSLGSKLALSSFNWSEVRTLAQTRIPPLVASGLLPPPVVTLYSLARTTLQSLDTVVVHLGELQFELTFRNIDLFDMLPAVATA